MAVTEATDTGTGSQVLFPFTFEYLKATDVKVTVDGVLKTYLSDWDYNTPTVVQFNTAPANGSAIRIYRDTDDSGLKAEFYPGSAIKAQDLNDNFTQNLYVTQETTNEAAASTATSNTAKTAADAAKLATDNLVGSTSDGGTTWTTAGDGVGSNPKGVKYAITESETAVQTSNSATNTANTAKNAVDTYVHDGTSLKGDGIAPNPQGLAYSVNQVNTYVHDGTQPKGDGQGGNPKGLAFALDTVETYVHDGTTLKGDGIGSNPKGVKYAVDNADLALNNSREDDGSGGFNTAIDLSNTALNNSQDSNGNSAISIATQAQSDAQAAQQAVANSVAYNPVANVASIPSSPSQDYYAEVSDSTGIENFTPLTGLPNGFTGDPFLTARLKYVGSTWVWQAYFSSDPENRYVSRYGKHSTSQIVYEVKVATKTAAHRFFNQGSALGYLIDGVEAPFLHLIPGNVYRFDQSDSSNSGHPIGFYFTNDKQGSHVSGVTTFGTPGSSGAYTDILITDITPSGLSYQCQAHGYMGHAFTTNTATGGGATGGGADQAFLENDITITNDYTISTNKNALSTGPIAINNGVVVTVPQNSLWKVI